MNHRIATQASAFVPLSRYSLAEILDALAQRSVELQAYAAIDRENGFELTLTTTDAAAAVSALHALGISAQVDSVIAFEPAESKGRLARLAHALMRALIKVDYICPSTSLRGDPSSILMKVSNLPLASRILTEAA